LSQQLGAFRIAGIIDAVARVLEGIGMVGGGFALIRRLGLGLGLHWLLLPVRLVCLGEARKAQKSGYKDHCGDSREHLIPF
jgi:hypothetical protein